MKSKTLQKLKLDDSFFQGKARVGILFPLYQYSIF